MCSEFDNSGTVSLMLHPELIVLENLAACSDPFYYRLKKRKFKSAHHSVVCLTTVPWPPPNPVLHRVRPSASSFNFQYLLFSLRSSSSYYNFTITYIRLKEVKFLINKIQDNSPRMKMIYFA
jgi:hypothetical protein